MARKKNEETIQEEAVGAADAVVVAEHGADEAPVVGSREVEPAGGQPAALPPVGDDLEEQTAGGDQEAAPAAGVAGAEAAEAFEPHPTGDAPMTATEIRESWVEMKRYDGAEIVAGAAERLREASQNPWLSFDQARDEAIARAVQAAGPVDGMTDDLWEQLATQLDRDPGAAVDVLLNVLGRPKLADPVAAQERVWALTAFGATYNGLMRLARTESARHGEHGRVEPAPDPVAAELDYLRRVKRRERLARGTPYWRRIRERRRAAEKRVEAAIEARQPE